MDAGSYPAGIHSQDAEVLALNLNAHGRHRHLYRLRTRFFRRPGGQRNQLRGLRQDGVVRIAQTTGKGHGQIPVLDRRIIHRITTVRAGDDVYRNGAECACLTCLRVDHRRVKVACADWKKEITLEGESGSATSMKVIAIVGYSGSGKTTLIEKLLR